MKRITHLLIPAAALLWVWCTSVDFNNPLDPKSGNYVGDEKAGDHDGDGIPNVYDEDYQRAKDTTAPVITFVGGDTVLFRQGDPAQVLARDTAKAIDDFSGNISKDIEIIPDIFTSLCDVQLVTYRVTDVAGNVASRPRVIIVDCEEPLITLAGENPMNLQVNDAYTEPGATAVDNIDGAIAANKIAITGTVRTTSEHVDTVTYSTTDRAGNKATKKRIVIVTESPDTEPPVIALKGANPLSLREGTPYVEPGYTVTDNRDTDLQNKVEVTGGPVNTTVPGRDTLTYTVTDKAGNSASVKRIIVITTSGPIEDKTPPDLKLLGASSIEVPVGGKYNEPGWTAIDNVDGDLHDSVKITELFGKKIDPISTVSPTTFNLVYTVYDSAGNKAEVSREVKIVGTSTDVTPPEIRLEGKVKDTVKLGSTYVDPGATATDDIDGVISTKITKVVKALPAGTVVPINTFTSAIGDYSITYSVSDNAGNPAIPVVRSVYVKDTFIDPNNLLLKYGVPLATTLPTFTKTYSTSITTDGTGAPNMGTVTSFTLGWRNDPSSKGLDNFAFQITGGYLDLKEKITHTFDQVNPGFTLTGSGITGLDGEYYIKADATQCVWVKKDGTAAIIFK
jgi:hypothetical protein